MKIEELLSSITEKKNATKNLLVCTQVITVGSVKHKTECKKCGRKEETNALALFRDEPCPSCGAVLHKVRVGIQSSFIETETEISETDDGVAIVRSVIEYQYSGEGESAKGAVKSSTAAEITASGVRVNEKKMTIADKRWLSTVAAKQPEFSRLLEKRFGVGSFNELCGFFEEAAEAKKSAAKASRKEITAEIIEKYLSPISPPDVPRELQGHVAYTWNSNENGKEVRVYCPGKNRVESFFVAANDYPAPFIPLEGDPKEFAVCPICKECVTVSSYAYNSTANFIVNTTFGIATVRAVAIPGVAPEDTPLIIERATTQYTIDEKSNCVKWQTRPDSGLIITKKKVMAYYVYNTKEVRVGNLTGRNREPLGYRGSLPATQSRAEIEAEIASSVAKYHAIPELFLKEKDGVLGFDPDVVDYEKMLLKVPALKVLCLAGFTAFLNRNSVNDVLSSIPNPKATKPHEAFEISRAQFRNLRLLPHKCYSDILDSLQLVQSFPDMPEETCEKIVEFGSHLDGSMLSRLKNLSVNIPIEKAIDYVDTASNFQCLSPGSVLGFWTDYLRMADALGYRLDNKNTLFPKSLRLEHDRASFLFSRVNKETSEEFRKKAEEAKKYEYSFEDFFVKIPETAAELIREGRELKHCCASFVKPVESGSSIIAFIRRKKEPDTAFYTALIENGSVKEVCGYCNCEPTREVAEFVGKWKKAKKI